MCEQQRHRAACASAQADQCLCCSLELVFFSTKKHLTNLNGEQNDTWNLLVSHRICHFRAIQPFDIDGWCLRGAVVCKGIGGDCDDHGFSTRKGNNGTRIEK